VRRPSALSSQHGRNALARVWDRRRRCLRKLPVRAAGPGRRTSDRRRQVSWLAGLCCAAPSRPSGQWRVAAPLSAYSCGHSRGLKADLASHRVPFSRPCGRPSRAIP